MVRRTNDNRRAATVGTGSPQKFPDNYRGHRLLGHCMSLVGVSLDPIRFFDEKSDEQEFAKAVGSIKNVLRLSAATSTFRINSGARTYISTTGASVMQFSINSNNLLTMGLTTTTCPELATISALFEEYKVSGILCRYSPQNPYNRGAVTISVPIAVLFDDIDSAVTVTNSLAGMAALVNRGSEYYSFSPDHSWERAFTRRQNMANYDWTPFSAPGSEPSSFGALYVAGDGANTASVVYGALDYWFMIEARMRF